MCIFLKKVDTSAKSIKKGITTMKWQNVFIWFMRIIFILASIIEGFNWQAQYLLISGLLLSFIPELVQWLGKIKIPHTGKLTLTLFVFGSQYLGSYLGFYGKFSWWDILLHSTSGILIGYWLLIYLVYLNREIFEQVKSYRLLIISVLFLGGVAAAGLWEVAEFLGDTFLGFNAQHGSLRDTMTDIICGTIGAGVFAAYIGFRMKDCKKGALAHLLNLNPIGFRERYKSKNS